MPGQLLAGAGASLSARRSTRRSPVETASGSLRKSARGGVRERPARTWRETARRPGTRGSRACSSTSSRAPTQPSSISPNVTSTCCASACSSARRGLADPETVAGWSSPNRPIWSQTPPVLARLSGRIVPARPVRPVSDGDACRDRARAARRPPSKGQGAADKAQQGHTPWHEGGPPLPRQARLAVARWPADGALDLRQRRGAARCRSDCGCGRTKTRARCPARRLS